MIRGQESEQRAETVSEAWATSEAGVTRMDLVCSPRIEFTAQQMARRWGRDRALPAEAVDRLATLVLAAVRHGLRFGPRGVTILVRWLDTDRVRVDVRWRGCSGSALSRGPAGDVESTAATLDALAEGWGFGASSVDPVQWIVLDSR